MLSSPLREFDSENQMPVSKPVHLLARLGRIRSVDEADKGKALRPASVSIFGEEYSCDATKTLEQVSEFLFFGHFGNLVLVGVVSECAP